VSHHPTPAEIIPRNVLQSLPGSTEAESKHARDALRFCPPRLWRRYERTLKLARTRPTAAIKLNCLDCVCWDYGEARRCEITYCALYRFNRRIFGGEK